MTLLHYLTPALLAWEAFVTLALLGFGLGTLRLLKRRELPVGIAFCTGIAVWLLLGGALNLLHAATKPVLLTFLVAGSILCLLELRNPTLRQSLQTGLRRLWPAGNWTRAAASVLVLWFSLCFIAHLGTFAWNRFDDLQAYTAFADKAAALGSLQPDPFSERRITSGVGGALFLNVTMLAGADNRGIDYLEGSLGLAVLLLLAGTLTRRFRLGPWRTLAVFLALAVFTLGRANISSVNLSAALFLALLLLQIEPGAPGLASETWVSSILTGLLVGAAFTLKSSNIPFCVLFLTGCAVVKAGQSRSFRPLGNLTLAGLIAVAVAAPWAVKHRLDEGTALFPSLGRGYHLSAYGFPTIAQTVPSLISLGASLPDFLPPLLAGLLALPLLRRNPNRATLATFLFAAALSAPLFSVAVAAEDIDRFLLPILNLSAVLFLTILLASEERPWRPTAMALFSLWTAAFILDAIQLDFFRDPGDLALLFGNPGLLTRYEAARTPAQVALITQKVRRAQQSIPAGATLLEEIQDAYAFDFARNNVLFADYPGMASPPPGLPLDGTPAQARTYLLAQGVHFLILDRTLDRAQYPNVDYAGFRQHPQVHPTWHDVFAHRDIRGYSRMEYQVSARTQFLLNALATPPRILYDEDKLVLVDLDRE